MELAFPWFGHPNAREKPNLLLSRSDVESSVPSYWSSPDSATRSSLLILIGNVSFFDSYATVHSHHPKKRICDKKVVGFRSRRTAVSVVEIKVHIDMLATEE